MPVLTVKNFSCIEEAEISLADLTILIGPQASGKSVLSKLVYFFYNAISRQYRAIEDNLPFDQFNESLCEEFNKWFPPTAWGSGTFEISFKAGVYFAKVTKVTRAKASRPEVRIDFSDWFSKEYNSTLAAAVRSRNDLAARSERDIRAHGLDYIWRLREAADKRFREALKGDYFEFQIFIPAGRSYFTSLGKTLPAFEHSGLLDPVTVEFGRFFTSIREFRSRRLAMGRREGSFVLSQRALGEKLFGGEIRFEREQGYVEGQDGRKVPLSFLSSGQQELLPLWLTLEYLAQVTSNCLLYIEEPEAHLFPTAQSQIIEMLASILGKPQSNTNMLITTHSPYVLTQLNILLKAGTLGITHPKLAEKVNKVVRRESWLPPGSTNAYAIVGKRVKPIFDDTGLVDGHYLDEVSGFLDEDFQKLLDIESGGE